MRLGELIKRLKKYDSSHQVRFDFCRLVPTTVDSWRGIYAELALGFDFYGDKTVGDLLEELQGAIGNTFGGYKGGTYRMDEDTPVHVDNYSECTNTEIVFIGTRYDTVILYTGIEE